MKKHPPPSEDERRKGRDQELPPGSRLRTLYSGECQVSANPHDVLATILGSCVAACVFDPFARVGGMNHFLLPEACATIHADHEQSMRFGAYAMEQLINGILMLGGMKRRLQVKVFGGANVLNQMTMIGSKNVEFVRDFLTREELPITSEDLGDTCPRRVRFFPTTGRVQLLRLKRREDLAVLDEERQYADKVFRKPVEGSVELF